MNKQIPTPLKKKLFLLALSIFLISAFGFIWSIATHDRVGLLLSLAVAVAGSVKTFSLIRNTQTGNFEIYEGSVISDKRLPVRKRHEVLLQVEDDVLRFVFDGHPTLTPGVACRLYVQKDAAYADDLNIPDALRPARVLLGYDTISGDEAM
jgi:hypothetical protein